MRHPPTGYLLLLLGTLLTSVACGPPALSPVPADQPTTPSGWLGTSGDTLRIAGPTVVAFFAVTEAEIEADDVAMEALSVFQYHLPAMERGLAGCGVTLLETYASSVHLVRGGRVELLHPRELPSPAGYLMIDDGRPAEILEGMYTDADLFRSAVAYFGLPGDCWRSANRPR